MSHLKKDHLCLLHHAMNRTPSKDNDDNGDKEGDQNFGLYPKSPLLMARAYFIMHIPRLLPLLVRLTHGKKVDKCVFIPFSI